MPRGGVLGKRKVASLSSASGIWNLDDVAIERKGGRWPGSALATGGTVTDITDGGVNYRVHTFTTSGTFTFEANTNLAVE